MSTYSDEYRRVWCRCGKKLHPGDCDPFDTEALDDADDEAPPKTKADDIIDDPRYRGTTCEP